MVAKDNAAAFDEKQQKVCRLEDVTSKAARIASLLDSWRAAPSPLTLEWRRSINTMWSLLTTSMRTHLSERDGVLSHDESLSQGF